MNEENIGTESEVGEVRLADNPMAEGMGTEEIREDIIDAPNTQNPENQDTSKDFDTEANALGEVGAITDRERFIALRKMGLSLKEATLLASGGVRRDTLSHLTGCVPGAARAPESAMTPFEFETARAIFDGLSDSEIHLLYKKVTR